MTNHQGLAYGEKTQPRFKFRRDVEFEFIWTPDFAPAGRVPRMKTEFGRHVLCEPCEWDLVLLAPHDVRSRVSR